MIVQGLLLIDPFRPPVPGWVAIQGGRIEELGEGEPPERADAAAGRSELLGPRAVSADTGHPYLICPGFIDAHLHLPQIDSVGCDGLTLLEWLDQVIFPAETRWADEAFAERQAKSAYARLLRAGTLGFAGYLTSHFESYAAVVRAGHAMPLRAVVGQVMMDRHAPQELLGHRLTRLARSERARVETSVNPRFAVSCSDEQLRQASKRAAASDAIIQTHLAESKSECELVSKLFPNDPNYTSVYDRFGLLTERTLLAHCVHLSDDEWRLIAQRRSVVVHCPTANTFLRSGVFDLDAAREHGVRLALGSDIAAGSDIAMPRVARAMIEMAKLRAMTIAPHAYVPSPAEAWQQITFGNAQALGWKDAGRLEAGAAADLLILQPHVTFDEHLIGRMLYTWRDDYIQARIVNGVLHSSTL